jgi:hypothetical protein
LYGTNLADFAGIACLDRCMTWRGSLLPRHPAPMQALREIRPRHRPTLIRLRAALPLRNPPDSLILAFMEHPSSIKRSVESQPSPLFAVAAAPTSGPVDVYALLFVGPSADALLAARRERNIGRKGVSVLWMVYRHIGGADWRLRKCLFLLEGSGRCATVDRPERASPTVDLRALGEGRSSARSGCTTTVAESNGMDAPTRNGVNVPKWNR